MKSALNYYRMCAMDGVGGGKDFADSGEKILVGGVMLRARLGWWGKGLDLGER